jgi:hypothetical protein
MNEDGLLRLMSAYKTRGFLTPVEEHGLRDMLAPAFPDAWSMRYVDLVHLAFAVIGAGWIAARLREVGL